MYPLPKLGPDNSRVFIHKVKDGRKVVNAEATMSYIRLMGTLLMEMDLSYNKILIYDGLDMKIPNGIHFTPMLFKKSTLMFQVTLPGDSFYISHMEIAHISLRNTLEQQNV